MSCQIMNKKNMNKRQIQGFDLLKFIMALFIVGIHAHFSDSLIANNYQLIGGGINKIQGLTVPIFFVISSFLFFRKSFSCLKDNNKLYLKFIKRLGIVYLFYFILLSPVIINNRGWFDMDLVTGALSFIKDVFLRYTYPGSWFLSALVMATTIVFFLGKKINHWVILIISFVLLLYIYNVELLPTKYRFLYNWYDIHIRDIKLSFPVALFWISMGACFAKINENLERLEKYKYGLWILFLFFYISTYFLPINELSTVFMVAVLIIIFYNLKFKRHLNIYLKLREYSILFFFWHFIVLQVIKVALHNRQFEVLGVWLYPITLGLVLIISTLIVYLENKKYFKWLRYSH